MELKKISFLLAALLLRARAWAPSEPEVIGSIHKFKEFFQSTYIRKETGILVPDKMGKPYFPSGYMPSWSLFRMHHVCVSGGGDGLFVGYEGEDGKITKDVLGNDKNMSNLLTQGKWNELIGSKFKVPLTAYNFKANNYDSKVPPKLYRNATLFANCNRQHSLSINPSYFMMKTGCMYELAECAIRNMGRHPVFVNPLILPFRQIFLHQCPNPDRNSWDWGQTVWDIIKNKMTSANMFKDGYTDPTFLGTDDSVDEISCFEDIYVSVYFATLNSSLISPI